MRVLMLFAVVLLCTAALSQTPEEGAHEIQVWTSGGQNEHLERRSALWVGVDLSPRAGILERQV